jgi:hypothetical protein
LRQLAGLQKALDTFWRKIDVRSIVVNFTRRCVSMGVSLSTVNRDS